MIRVLIADDHSSFRRGLRSLLGTYPDLDVVGESADGHEAVTMVQSLKPDLVLLDIGMPGMNGLDALKKIKDLKQEVKVLILTQYDLDEYLFAVLQGGALGYILKESASDELIPAIQTVSDGKAYLSPAMLRTLINEFVERNESREVILGELTPREAEVLKLLAEGKSAREVSDQLNVSLNTIQTHRYHIMDKLNLHNRAELVKYAIRKGIISP